ncbi:hypothetical protein Ddye_012110 [Dipteronia dyeriana]|uniref:HAT C-terminal dimerisation domain-containing protein n=1 Tax=Dipteronia dyeriana TaxID=168575 RepID=A0AAE0CI76_9ROSI|nr:hypothetical protein Ddye_012110 [Dipteronia dyeriana]
MATYQSPSVRFSHWVSLEVFSTAERILENRRCSLAHDTAEALTCLMDWENTSLKQQHQLDNEELMDDFSNMTIDESSGHA